MRIFNELRYPSSNLSEIFTQRMFQASFEKIWKIFFELSRGQAWSYGRTDRQTDRRTDRRTDRQTDRRTDAGNDNTPPALGPRGKNWIPLFAFHFLIFIKSLFHTLCSRRNYLTFAWCFPGNFKIFLTFIKILWLFPHLEFPWLFLEA